MDNRLSTLPLRRSALWLALGTLSLLGCAGLKIDAPSSQGSTLMQAADSANPGVYELADPTIYSAVDAISDVHGMYDNLVPLLQGAGLIDSNLNWTGGKTLLLIVGDSIDKGPKSIPVLDLWMKLAPEALAAGGRVEHLLGNHEAEFLADPTNKKTKVLQQELQQDGMAVTDLTDPTQPRGAYLHAEPLAAKVGQWLFIHAGLYPNMPWSQFKQEAISVLNQGNYSDPFLAGSNSCLEAKNWWNDATTRSQLETTLAANGMWGMVQGHQPAAYNMPGQIGSIDNGHLIKIDNGMAPQAGANPGHILRFPDPAQMMQPGFPLVQSIANDGTVQTVEPVDFSKLPVAKQLDD